MEVSSKRADLMIFAFGSSLTTAWVLIRLAASAYRSVLSVSSSASQPRPACTIDIQSAGLYCQPSVDKGGAAHDIAAIIAVFEFPPRLSFSSQVNTESRYGTWSSFFFLAVSLACAKAAMTLPRVVKDLLIFAPSFSLVPCLCQHIP